jgi:hypothetical protein
MRRRRLLLGAGLLILVAALVLTAAWFLRHRANPNVTEENFCRLKYRMSPGEVAAVFGGPWKQGDWSFTLSEDLHWEGEDSLAVLWFDAGGLAEGTLYRRDREPIKVDFGAEWKKERSPMRAP